MLKNMIMLLCALALSPVAMAQQKITTVILVRHAEKVADGSDDPELKPEGTARAAHLAEVLQHSDIDGVYATPFKRTQNTVMPLAKAKNVAVQLYDPKKADEIDNLVKKHVGGTLVVCGHSNTVPRMANRLIGKEQFAEFDDSAYNNLIIISVVETGKATKVTWLTY
ncbi:SixA phosphatase family protein [Chryseolinea lacunae]|uniref:Histidine phosphatase family protein n=1 Tax=Chryseolinea lacunae TaxID=2801331 RepID=A0ABS1KJF5_9BACT|nr:phosphoglycerate mutase family protein [Chryseolinea lacunae]MBL0739593.1 histidine phosphatase family protein [Chryseolinea lacunae]